MGSPPNLDYRTTASPRLVSRGSGASVTLERGTVRIRDSAGINFKIQQRCLAAKGAMLPAKEAVCNSGFVLMSLAYEMSGSIST